MLLQFVQHLGDFAAHFDRQVEVPELDGSSIVCGGQLLAVGGERHAGDPIGVAGQCRLQ